VANRRARSSEALLKSYRPDLVHRPRDRTLLYRQGEEARYGPLVRQVQPIPGSLAQSRKILGNSMPAAEGHTWFHVLPPATQTDDCKHNLIKGVMLAISPVPWPA